MNSPIAITNYNNTLSISITLADNSFIALPNCNNVLFTFITFSNPSFTAITNYNNTSSTTIVKLLATPNYSIAQIILQRYFLDLKYHMLDHIR